MDNSFTLVLLPGLNGTEGLFKPLLDTKPENIQTLSISYPVNEKYSYDQLCDYTLQQLRDIDGNFILLGESFSGPLSLMISRAKPSGLAGLILVATFIDAPNLSISRLLPWNFLFGTVKRILWFGSLFVSETSLIKLLAHELRKVSLVVLAYRMSLAFGVDAKSALKECPVPIVYFQATGDLLVPKKNLRRIQTVRPDVKAVCFSTHHFLLQSEPQLAWDAIVNFAMDLGLE